MIYNVLSTLHLPHLPFKSQWIMIWRLKYQIKIGNRDSPTKSTLLFNMCTVSLSLICQRKSWLKYIQGQILMQKVKDDYWVPHAYILKTDNKEHICSFMRSILDQGTNYYGMEAVSLWHWGLIKAQVVFLAALSLFVLLGLMLLIFILIILHRFFTGFSWLTIKYSNIRVQAGRNQQSRLTQHEKFRLFIHRGR